MAPGWAFWSGGAGLLAGVWAQLQMAELWPAAGAWPWAWLLAAKGLALAAAGWRWRQGGAGLLAWTLGLAALAFATTHERAAARLAEALPPALEGQDLQLTGVVVSLPRESLEGVTFVLEVESARRAGQPVQVPGTVSLGWWRGVDDMALLAGPAEPLRAGQRWRFTVRLKQPHGAANPQGFDVELWLWEQGIRATGAVRSRPGDEAQLLDPVAGAPVQRLRQAVRDAIQARVADPAAAGVLAALAIGDQAAIERADWELFRITGVAHLMSISGLHVTMFAWLAGAVVGALWRRQARACLWLPAPQAARWGGLTAALAYAVLAGWGVPAQRTVGMIAVVVLLRTRGVQWPLPAVLLTAAVAVALADPWALLQPGFWLSFVAVALLVASEPVQRGLDRAVAAGAWAAARRVALGALRTQAVATVGLAPLTLLFFQQLSLVGFVANLAAIPLVTLAITPLALLGVLLPPLWTLAAALVQALVAALDGLAGWPWAQWTAAAAPPWAAAAGLLGGALAVLPLPWQLRLLALPLMLPLLAPPVSRPAPGHFELLAADVGQGSAVLLRTAHHLLVYDTGPRTSRESDAGQRVLLPLLRTRGERAVDLLVLSHRDTDHVGGAESLLRALPVRAMASSLEDAHPLRQRGLVHSACAAGQRWQWDGVVFEVLHPLPGDSALPLKPNALSCVLRVQANNGASVLLAGDIEAPQEAALVARAGAALRSSVLLVPHHGSRTSSTGAWLDAVAPRVALVQAAYRSRFGHPAPDVLARHEARSIAVVRSDRCGAYTWRSDGGATCQRSTADGAARYWQHPLRQVAPQP